jgi:methyltransferase family protein
MFEGLRSALWRARDTVRDHLKAGHRQDVFTKIYNENLWGSEESRSGVGSSEVATVAIVKELPSLWKRYGIRSLVDAPCGDCRWMSQIAPNLESYIGVDIVPGLIESNRTKYSSLAFNCADLTREVLPKADAILCRDCFQHLPTRLILSALKNFRDSGARWAFLTTNDDVRINDDAVIGGFRPINLRLPPFSFPNPMEKIAEDDHGRSLALWPLHT